MDRAAEVQSLFGVHPVAAPVVVQPVAVQPQAPPKFNQFEVARKVQQAITETGKADYEKAVREYQIPLSSIRIPDKDEVFGNMALLEPLLVVLLDEDFLVHKVVNGVLPVTTYATARELAKIVRNKWPQEMHFALTKYQEARVKASKPANGRRK